jgi:phage protein D
LKIRNDLTEKVDEMVLVLGSRCAQYETEKLRKRQIENQRLMEAAKKEREKLLKKAEDSKKPETKEKYEEIAELIVAPTEEIDLKNMEKKIQVKDQEEFLKWAIGIPEIIENISVSKTGLKKIIDKNFSIDRSHYVESMNAYYQKVPGAVIIARKK